jgi:uncharacterized membrane protein YeaQ/YmgE (transglycosylase-associated protein family)
MILAWVFVGLIIAGMIARINQSNKLFWILFTSFMVGIAGSTVYNKCRATQCKTESSSYYHTLSTCPTTNTICSVTIDGNMYLSDNSLTAAGNGKLEFNEDVQALSKCCVETRKQPPRSLKLKKECSNILTHPEEGFS